MLIHFLDNMSFYDLNNLALRIVLACAFACLLVLLSGRKVIAMLHQHQLKGQPIRKDGPKSHLLTKKGTPTMGGIMILGSAIVSMLLFCSLN